MPESTADHELESFGSVCSVTGNHGVLGHDLSDASAPGVETFGGYLIIVSYFFLFKARIKNTLKARSFAVKIPLRPSSSSTTKTQSALLAAQSWLASATLMPSGTVKAGLGLKPATVPFWGRLLERLPPLDCWVALDPGRFRESSDSIFLRRDCSLPAKEED